MIPGAYLPMAWVESFDRLFVINDQKKMQLFDLDTQIATTIGNGSVGGIPDITTTVVDNLNLKIYITVVDFENNYLVVIDLKSGRTTKIKTIGSYTSLYLELFLFIWQGMILNI